MRLLVSWGQLLGTYSGGLFLVPVIDLFAGPGGLGEGFSSLIDREGKPVFQIVLSIECDQTAHQTLRMRSFFRKLTQKYGKAPHEYHQYIANPTDQSLEKLKAVSPELWESANEEALCAELVERDNSLVELGRKRLENAGVKEGSPWVLIGGPPCQAYSLVGRSRRTNDKEGLERDKKQTLYKCYLAFIRKLKPTVFVMENVKGLLSASHKGERVFARICSDMEKAGYRIYSLAKENPTDPRDYIVKAEEYGIPQKRHRVILVGVRKRGKRKPGTLSPSTPITLREALEGIPAVRSGFSNRNNDLNDERWQEYIQGAAKRILNFGEGADLKNILGCFEEGPFPTAMSDNTASNNMSRYASWYRGRMEPFITLPNHTARPHLAADLVRYLFCAAYAEKNGRPAHITDFPKDLYPNHKNVRNLKKGEAMKFPDRFRVQIWDEPSTTITSHIAKDGHYYIHPDPRQCRSLTVREAARLQTFPDDYFFEGERTSQYTQVGNAVPPLLAQQIAKVVATYLDIETWGFCDSLISVYDDQNVLSDKDNRLFVAVASSQQE